MNNENAKKDTKEPELVTKIEEAKVEQLADKDLEKIGGGGEFISMAGGGKSARPVC